MQSGKDHYAWNAANVIQPVQGCVNQPFHSKSRLEQELMVTVFIVELVVSLLDIFLILLELILT